MLVRKYTILVATLLAAASVPAQGAIHTIQIGFGEDAKYSINNGVRQTSSFDFEGVGGPSVTETFGGFGISLTTQALSCFGSFGCTLYGSSSGVSSPDNFGVFGAADGMGLKNLKSDGSPDGQNQIDNKEFQETLALVFSRSVTLLEFVLIGIDKGKEGAYIRTPDFTILDIARLNNPANETQVNPAIGWGTFFESNNGVFTSIPNAPTWTGTTFYFSAKSDVGYYLQSLKFQYNDSTTSGAIPEPSTYALLAGGLGLMALARRRQRAR